MERKLCPAERVELEARHKRERDGRIRDRIKAVLAYDDGYSYSEIAKILLLDDDTIRRHVQGYFTKFKLKPENGGSTSHLNESQTTLLLIHLREITYLHVKDICAYVADKFEKTYSISGMTQWLHAHHFDYKKPHGVPAKADAEKQAAFIEQYNSLKVSLTERDVMYFMDSSHPQHQTQLAYGWIETGVRKALKMTACQKRVHLIGALNLQGHVVEYRQVEWVNIESIRDFFKQLMAANPTAERIHIILDNAGYHKSKELLSFIETTNITLHYLPPYSPNLNPIERLWKIMHEQVTYNRYYPKLSDFKEAVLNFFNNIEQFKPIIQSRINDNFQRLVTA